MQSAKIQIKIQNQPRMNTKKHELFTAEVKEKINHKDTKTQRKINHCRKASCGE